MPEKEVPVKTVMCEYVCDKCRSDNMCYDYNAPRGVNTYQHFCPTCGNIVQFGCIYPQIRYVNQT